MSKRQSSKDDILKSIISFILDRLGNKIRSYVFEAAKDLIKKTILAFFGAALIIMGLIFVFISIVKYASIYIPIWTAWFVVGLAVLLIGFLISIVTLRR